MVCVVFMLLLVTGCVQTANQPIAKQAPAAVSEQPTPAETAAADTAPAVQSQAVPTQPRGIYDFEPEPLDKAVECAKCHITVFHRIKDQGGNHQIECVRCHTQFHVFNPKKVPYDKAIPRCETCHGVLHGPGTAEVPLTDCASCHYDPHAPLIIPAEETQNGCTTCHAKETAQINNPVTRHTTEVACVDCHADKHGFIPECNACHENHSPDYQMDSGACMQCHPVHTPTQIKYSADTPNLICAGCHDDVYGMLTTNPSKHRNVACVQCHPSEHKNILDCTDCHGLPHSKTLLQDVNNCQECHDIAHNLAT